MTRRRAGLTFVELMISMVIVALMSSIAVPKYHDIKRKAFAAKILGDFQVVRVASLNFYADSGHFPDDAPEGTVPTGLEKYLPQGFSFTQPLWTLDYERVVITPSRFVAGDELVGVAVVTPDAMLGETALAMLHGATLSIGGKYTFIISGM